MNPSLKFGYFEVGNSNRLAISPWFKAYFELRNVESKTFKSQVSESGKV